MNEIAQLERSVARMEPQNMSASPCPSSLPKEITDAEVEEFINGLAATGAIQDNLGYSVRQSDLHWAAAAQWRSDKEAVGSIIGPIFWRDMKAKAWLAKYGI